MWSDWLVFCDYGFSVSALWCPLATPTVLLGFLLPWTWGISSRLLQQSAATAPYLGPGVSPHRRPSWPWTWSSSSRPSFTRWTELDWTELTHIQNAYCMVYIVSSMMICIFFKKLPKSRHLSLIPIEYGLSFLKQDKWYENYNLG